MYRRLGMGVVNGNVALRQGRVASTGRDQGIDPLIRAGVIPMEGRETVFDVSAPIYRLDATPQPAPTPAPAAAPIPTPTPGPTVINSSGPNSLQCPLVAPTSNNPNGYQFPDANGVCAPFVEDSWNIGAGLAAVPWWGWAGAAGGLWVLFGRKKR